MKKIIMSIIGLALALALVLAVWIPISEKGKTRGSENMTRENSINADIASLASPIPQ